MNPVFVAASLIETPPQLLNFLICPNFTNLILSELHVICLDVTHFLSSINFDVFFLHFQADLMANFHVGEVVTSLQRATLIQGGSESLVYTTLSGAIGMLVPFTSHEVILY